VRLDLHQLTAEQNPHGLWPTMSLRYEIGVAAVVVLLAFCAHKDTRD
jgi:hypothetical protein